MRDDQQENEVSFCSISFERRKKFEVFHHLFILHFVLADFHVDGSFKSSLPVRVVREKKQFFPISIS